MSMAERMGIPEVQLPTAKAPGLPKLTQTSKWSCIPTAFAMVLSKSDHSNAGRLLGSIMHQLGRDDERGFHIQELLSVGIGLGIAFVPFEGEPEVERVVCKGDGCREGKVTKYVNHLFDYIQSDCKVCDGTGLGSKAPLVLHPLGELLMKHDGVLIGRRIGAENMHAAAWCKESQQVLDPEEGVYDIERFEIMTFWAAFHVK